MPAFESFDAVREGKAHLLHAAPSYWTNKRPSIPFPGAVPGGQELWDELYGEFDLKPLVAGNTGTQMGGWFKKEINSLSYFQGLKMWIPGLGAEVINRLSDTAVNLPSGEIMPALQSRVSDATD